MENESSRSEVRLERIVSGGQSGVDRAALDAAMEAGVSVGGWCPSGRRAVDGRIADRYPLRETPSEEYAERTSWNVRDSDGTLVLVHEEPSGGTAFTIEEARRLGRPVLVVDPTTSDVEQTRAWIARHRIGILNVAGPRDDPGGEAYAAASGFIRSLLSH